MMTPENGSGKRSFLKSGLRLLMVGAVAGVGGVLGMREGSAGGEKRRCAIGAPCGGCPEFDRCGHAETIQRKPDADSR